MRLASWMFIVCVTASALGVFLPAVGVRNAGPLANRTSLSLYQAATDREVIRKLVTGYNRSSGKHVGGAVVALLGPHAGGHLKEYVDDAHDAMDTIGGVTDDDAKHAATLFAITIWGFLLLHAVIAGLVLRETVNGGYRRGAIVAAAAISLVTTAIAIAIVIGCRRAAWEANDELGHDAFAAAAGAYVIAVASCGGLVASIGLIVLRRRRIAT